MSSDRTNREETKLTPRHERLPWFDAGSHARGFIAFGNVAEGFIAFGNIARGVVAFGFTAATGLVACGMNAGGGVAVGLNAVGPISISLINGVGVLVIAGVNACGTYPHASTNTEPSPWIGIVVCVLALLGALILRRMRTKPVEIPSLVPLASIVSGELELGCVRATLVGLGARGPTLREGATEVLVLASPAFAESIRYLHDAGEHDVVANLRGEEVASSSALPGYRDAPPVQRVLHLSDITPYPHRRRELRSLDTADRITSAGLVVLAVGGIVATLLSGCAGAFGIGPRRAACFTGDDARTADARAALARTDRGSLADRVCAIEGVPGSFHDYSDQVDEPEPTRSS